MQAKDPATHGVVLEGHAKVGLYELLLYLNQVGDALLCVTQSHSLWHCHLGHLNSSYMSVLLNRGLIKSTSRQSKLCDSCLAGKSHTSPHPPSKTSYAPLALVIADIWGPSLVISHQGYSYNFNFVDAASNFNWVFPLVRKSVYKVFEEFYR